MIFLAQKEIPLNEIPSSPTPAPAASQPPAQSFWDHNGRRIIQVVIVLAVIGGIVAYSRSQNNSNEPSNSNTPNQNSNQGLNVTDRPVPAPSPVSGPVTYENKTVTVTAQRGEGYTHLARRALAEYLRANGTPEGLQAEHKIYIEDYLQKRLASKTGVRIGSQIGFTDDQVRQAIDSSMQLSSSQLQNLHQYVLRVPNL